MKGNEQIVIRGEGQFKSIEELANTAINTDKDGIPLLLGNIATVKIGPSIRFGLITKGGQGEVVGGTVMMLIGENSREVVEVIKKSRRIKKISLKE